MSSKKSSIPSQPKTPTFQGSANYSGNDLVSRTSYDKKLGVVTHYYPTSAQAAQQTATQNQINQILPTLGVTAPEISKQYDDIANSYADQATAAFNREYEPLQRSVREDYASRFGGGQNTPYIDAINDMETRQRVPALVDIANNAAQKKQDLYNSGEANKLNQLQSLGYLLNGQQSTFLQNLQNPQQAAQQGNTFNQQNYAQQLAQYNANRQAQQQQAGNGVFSNIVGGVKAGAQIASLFI